MIVAPALASMEWPEYYRQGAASGEVKVGVTPCLAAMAETGIAVMASGPDTPAGLNLLAETPIIVVHESQILRYIDDIFIQIKQFDLLPRAVNIFTGPSRTADIEQTLDKGAHGPRHNAYCADSGSAGLNFLEDTKNVRAPTSLETVQAISFDLDDTLWHCAPAIDRANAALFRWMQSHAPKITNVHTPASLQDYQARIRLQHPELQRCVSSIRLTGLRTLLREFGYAETLAEDAFDTFYRARSNVELYEGALDMLALLKTRYRLAAITNGNADLDLIGIGRYFDVIHAANMEFAPKPEPDMFHECLRMLEIPSHALLHVGDNPGTDIVGGHNAGVQTLWFNQYNVRWPKLLPPPHFQARTLSDIVTLLVP